MLKVPFPVVGIGASAGGLEVFREFFKAMPPDSGIAFVLIQHLAPNHESFMVDLLSKFTDMMVCQAENGMALHPNQVYMIPPNKSLRVEDGRLVVEAQIKEHGISLPVDHFFRSLALNCRERGVGIILSGTGSDGSLGLKEIFESGGMTLVQQPDTAEYDGMPKNALATCAVDFVIPVGEMPTILMRYAKHPYVRGKKQWANHPWGRTRSVQGYS